MHGGQVDADRHRGLPPRAPSSSDSSTWPRWPTATSRAPARVIANSGLLAASRLGWAGIAADRPRGRERAPAISSATTKRTSPDCVPVQGRSSCELIASNPRSSYNGPLPTVTMLPLSLYLPMKSL